MTFRVRTSTLCYAADRRGKWTRIRSADIVAATIDSIFDSNMRYTHNALAYKTSIFAVSNAPKHKNKTTTDTDGQVFLCLKFYKRVINIEPKTALKEWCVTRCRSIMLRFGTLHRDTQRVSDLMIESWIRFRIDAHTSQHSTSDSTKLYIEKWTYLELE